MNTTSPQVVPPSNEVPAVIGEYVAIRPGYCGGKPHLVGYRIKVQHVAIWHERMGLSAEEIVATNPDLTLPAVYAALAYYHSHRGEIDADIAADEAFVNSLKANSGPSPLRRKLDALHAQNTAISPG